VFEQDMTYYKRINNRTPEIFYRLTKDQPVSKILHKYEVIMIKITELSQLDLSATLVMPIGKTLFFPG
jgi:hypothetical protein